MQVTREQIYAALYNQLLTVSAWAFADRRFHVITELQEGQFPAMMMLQKGELSEVQGRGVPIKWVLKVDVLVYVDSSNSPNRVPAQVVNPILDALELCIQPNINNALLLPQTLGGLVSQCRIKGEIVTDEFIGGSQAMVSIPLEIVVQS